MNATLLALTILLTFIALTISICIYTPKDSAGRRNNILLFLYALVALWLTLGLSICVVMVIYPLEKKTSLGQQKEPSSVIVDGKPGQKKISKPIRTTKPREIHYPPKEFFLYLFGVTLLISGIYLARRPEWADAVNKWIRSWRGSNAESPEKLLIEHGILFKEDRNWIDQTLNTLKEKDSNPSTPVGKEGDGLSQNDI